MSRPKKKTDVEGNGSVATEPASDTNGNAEPNGKKGPAFKVGPIPTGKGESVSGCVWENHHQMSDGREYTVHSIVLKVDYYDEERKEWRQSSGIRPSQLSTVQYVLRKCADYCFASRDKGNVIPI